MTTLDFTISVAGVKETAYLTCNNNDVSIIFSMNNGFCKTYTDSNFYTCFGRIREDNPNILFLCKGFKINVHPSSMSAQMSLGLKAYELTMGKAPTRDDIVYIFDYDDKNLTNNPEEQRDYFIKWIKSKKTS